MLRRRKDPLANYNLFYAESSLEAARRFGVQEQDVQITLLTWRGLRELTGCTVPTYSPDTVLAKGGIMFHKDGRYFVVYG